VIDLTPASWLQVLEQRLDHRWTMGSGAQLAWGVYDAYYEGDHVLHFATRKFREAFGSLFAAIADNWCQLVVDSSVERLKVQGFRFGAGQSADDDAWGIWQFNGMDAQSTMVHCESVKLGEAYWLVEPGPRGSSDPPRVTCEHPSQMIVACNPADHRDRRAALKKWREDDGFAYANLYLPDWTYKYRSQSKLSAGQRVAWRGIGIFPNRLGEVPVIPVSNAPGMLRGGSSDLQVAYPIQNALNKLLSDMLIGSEYQAFPQRVLLGVELPKGPDGMVSRAAELQASQARVWAIANENASAFEFSASDLSAFVSARESLIHGLTSKTKLPAHYVSGEVAKASGDALKAGETGLVAKVNDKKSPFGEAHEDTMRLAFRAMGDEARGKSYKAETIWKDSESRTFGELIDGLVKLSTIGVPVEALWERAGFSPTEIARFLKQRSLPNPTGVGDPGVTPPQPVQDPRLSPPGQMANAAAARPTMSPVN
jgi:hypothetical protein